MGYRTKQLTSNDPSRPKKGKSPWLGDDEFTDEATLLLSGSAKQCAGCRRVTHIRYLDDWSQRCPGCRA